MTGMMHIINGYVVNLRCRSTENLESLVRLAEARRDRAQEEIDSLQGELVRRGLRPLKVVS
jgi:hypothetical protein